MSSAQEPQTTTQRPPRKSNPRRRPSGGPSFRRGPPRPKRTEGEAEGEGDKPRPTPIPIPAELVGKRTTGKILTILKKGRSRFGFIRIIDGNELSPSIYFTLQQYKDSEFLRRGYVVEFEVAVDEQSRHSANDIHLTEEGKTAAAEWNEQYEQRRNERAGEEGSAKKSPRQTQPRRRRSFNSKTVNLKATCEGHAEEKDIEFQTSRSVGKLKSIITIEFSAPLEYKVYHITSENPKGEFLTKAILNKLNDGDKVHLGAAREEESK